MGEPFNAAEAVFLKWLGSFVSKPTFVRALQIVTLFLCSLRANGQETPIVTSFSTGHPWQPRNETLGFSIVTTRPIDVTALGVFDAGVPGLEVKRSVGVWTVTPSIAALLGRLNFAPGLDGFSLNGFLYQRLSIPIRLYPGRLYIFGADYPDTDIAYPTAWASAIGEAEPRYNGGGGFGLPGATYSGGPAFATVNGLFADVNFAPFQNLSFESAHDIPQFDPQGHPLFMSAKDALPGWDCYIGTDKVTTVWYDDLALDSAAIGLISANSQFLPKGPLVGGNYAVSLQAGYSRFGRNTPVSIAQTGLLPPEVRSIKFRGRSGATPSGEDFLVTFAGKKIPLTVVGTKEEVSGYVGDLTPYALQSGELRITAFDHFCFIDLITLASTLAHDPLPTIREDFAFNPSNHGWSTFGNTNLFRWSPEHQNIEVTWDSSKPNSYYRIPLNSTLTSKDDFIISFDLTLTDATSAMTSSEASRIPITVGFQNAANAARSDFFSSETNSPNLFGLHFFPDGGDRMTVRPTVTSYTSYSAYWTTNAFSVGMPFGVPLHVTLSYHARTFELLTTITTNGISVGDIGSVALFSGVDFRVDTFAIGSYADKPRNENEGQALNAHGWIDNVELTFPLPVENLSLDRALSGESQLAFKTQFNWSYVVEGSSNLTDWDREYQNIMGNGASLRVPLSTNKVHRFYRVLSTKID